MTLALDENGQLWWENQGGAAWKLFFSKGSLTTGEDCPYGPGVVGIDLLQDGNGQFHSLPDALEFNGETYFRVWSVEP